ncbi:hypothetical protein QBD00_002545 [Ochrobactrum sp. AN78]|nr:hypothetical protein [Ochrobactrum sp. AN78]
MENLDCNLKLKPHVAVEIEEGLFLTPTLNQKHPTGFAPRTAPAKLWRVWMSGLPIRQSVKL